MDVQALHNLIELLQEGVYLQGQWQWHSHKGGTPTNKQHMGELQWIPSPVLRTNNTTHTPYNSRQGIPDKILHLQMPLAPLILISYAASERLGILHFNLLNKNYTTQML